MGVKSRATEFQWGLDKGGGVRVGKGVSDRGKDMCKGWEAWQGAAGWERERGTGEWELDYPSPGDSCC